MSSLNYVQTDRLPNHDEQVLPALWADLFPPGLLTDLYENPFLQLCRNGKVNHDLLCSFLIQHHYYSQYFTRYLCAMMASLTEQKDVRALAENLFEEMGFDHPDAITHAELYLTSMTTMGIKPGSRPMNIETRHLIDAMFRYCRSPDPLDGLAALCLGAEAIVPVVYGAILTGLKHINVDPKCLKFFELHVAEDEQHAIVMRKIIDDILIKHPHRRAKVLAIGEDMVRLRMAMLNSISAQYLEAA